MNEDISLGLVIVIVLFLLLGSGVTLIGAIGLARAQNFYQRLHMPTLGTSCGVGSIIIASIIYSIYADHQLIVHEIFLSLFLVITTPVTLMMISRASMHRDQSEDWIEKKQDIVPQSMDVELEKFKKQHEMPAHKSKRTRIKTITTKEKKPKTAKATHTKATKNKKAENNNPAPKAGKNEKNPKDEV